MAAGHSIKRIKHGLLQAVDTVLPPRCIVSGNIVDQQGMIDPHIWRELSFISDPLCTCCGYPFDFALSPDSASHNAANDVLCASCLGNRPVFNSARAALVYDDVSRDMVLKFKHADHTYAVHAFVPWLCRVGEDMLARADYIVPVPLHRFRLLQRRYNQAALIAAVLAKGCGLQSLPEVLKRRRATASQGHMNYKERRKNVRNAFAVPETAYPVIAGKNIVLVDDVYTTGATVKECTKALLKAGAAEVHVLAVARVVRPQ